MSLSVGQTAQNTILYLNIKNTVTFMLVDTFISTL